MANTLQDPALALMSQHLIDSGFAVSVHWPEPALPIEWLETSIPEVFGDRALSVRLLSLEATVRPTAASASSETGEDADDDGEDDEALPPLSLIRMDALLPLAIDWQQLPLTLAAIEAMNDLLPFGAISLRPQASCWAWQYTLAAPALGFSAALGMRVIDSLRFYLEALGPALLAALERRAEPESVRDDFRLLLADLARASGEGGPDGQSAEPSPAS